MLNKENTKRAEEIAQQLTPLFKNAYKLGALFDLTRDKMKDAEKMAKSWQYPQAASDWEYIEPYGNQTKSEREYIRNIKENAPREWAARVAIYWERLHRAEDEHTAARINFTNYLNYFAAFLADLIRPIWRELAERQGLKTLAEIINQKNPTKDRTAGACRVAIYERGGELTQDKNASGQYMRIECAIYTGWACGISGECCKVYKKNPAEVWHYAENPQEMTAAQYRRNKEKIAQKVAAIEKARDELQQFARACGLLGFVEIVGEIKKTK